MKKFVRLSLVAAALVAAGAANANGVSFNTVAGSSFTNYFTLTPTLTNKVVLTVSGLGAQFSNLSFEVLSGGPSVTASLSNNSLVASFNDRTNNSYILNGGTHYTLKVSGITKAQPPGVFGIVSVNALGGTVAPVPEPETYAMLLAGLGLMGTVARRRMKA